MSDRDEGPGDSPPASSDARAALLRKYRLLCSWRRGKDEAFAPGASGDGGVASPASMRALAQEFPGALRELDLLGLPELERRVAVLARARGAGPEPGESDDAEPWIAWILSYHALMRDVLATKRATAPGAKPGAAPATTTEGAFERAVARPPAGRISLAVLGEVAQRFGVPTHRVAELLFPSRRARPPQPAR